MLRVVSRVVASRPTMPGPRRLRLGLVAAIAGAAPTTPAPSPAAALQLFVSPNGSDAGDGSAAHPFATLRRAQQALRGHPGSNVTIAAGVYANTTGPVLELGPGDSGRPGAPIVYACEQGAVVTLSSGFTMPSHAVNDRQAELDRQRRSERTLDVLHAARAPRGRSGRAAGGIIVPDRIRGRSS